MPKTYADFVREALETVKEMSCADARARFDGSDGTVFLDVREAEEVRRGAIPHAIVIPRGLLEGHVEDFLPERDVPIVIYCAAGNRSALAGRTLHEMGYTRVWSLAGGIRAWVREGHPVGPPAVM